MQIINRRRTPHIWFIDQLVGFSVCDVSGVGFGKEAERCTDRDRLGWTTILTIDGLDDANRREPPQIGTCFLGSRASTLRNLFRGFRFVQRYHHVPNVLER